MTSVLRASLLWLVDPQPDGPCVTAPQRSGTLGEPHEPPWLEDEECDDQ
jgi:hypothetical protein